MTFIILFTSQSLYDSVDCCFFFNFVETMLTTDTRNVTS